MRNRLFAVLVFAAVFVLPLPSASSLPSATVVPATVVETVHGFRETASRTASSTPGAAAPVDTPIAFSMVGFTTPPGAELEFRTADGDAWTAWHHAPVSDDGPDPGSAEARSGAARAGTEPVWVGSARRLQVRVAGAAPRDVVATLIDTAGLNRSPLERIGDAVQAAWSAPGRPATAAPPGPRIVSREEWGADESWRRGSPSYAPDVEYGVVHHTAGENGYAREDVPAILRGIYRFHTAGRGWNDIGYNALVDRFGTIYEGRAGGLRRAVVGAHAAGFNTASWGVAVLGDHSSTDVPVAAEHAVADVLAWRFDLAHVDVTSQITVSSRCSSGCKHPNGSRITIPTVVGHRDLGSTSCPGGRLYARLGAIRQRMLSIRGPVLLDDEVSPGRVFSGDDGLSEPVTFSVRLDTDARWTLSVTDPGGATVHTSQGHGSDAAATWSGTAGTAPGVYKATFSSPGRRPASLRVRVGTPPFWDDEGHLHEPGISDLAARGIASGCAPERFCPGNRVRRDQMASFLHRALQVSGRAGEPTGIDHFDDDDGNVHEAAIDALADEGAASGCGPRRYCPSRLVTRDQVASLLARAYDLPPSAVDHFDDDDGNLHEAAINALADHGISGGCGDRRYCPRATSTRAHMATFLSRAVSRLQP